MVNYTAHITELPNGRMLLQVENHSTPDGVWSGPMFYSWDELKAIALAVLGKIDAKGDIRGLPVMHPSIEILLEDVCEVE